MPLGLEAMDLELPNPFFVLPKFQGYVRESPHFRALVQYLHLLDPEDLPLIASRLQYKCPFLDK